MYEKLQKHENSYTWFPYIKIDKTREKKLKNGKNHQKSDTFYEKSIYGYADIKKIHKNSKIPRNDENRSSWFLYIKMMQKLEKIRKNHQKNTIFYENDEQKLPLKKV